MGKGSIDEQITYRGVSEVTLAYPPGAIERVQSIETDVLKAIASVCEELGIEWFADGGTAIGAVRHGGFIPWDDDIDIGMRIEDYHLFCEKAPEMLPAEYGIYTHAATPNYPPLWAKVYRKGTRFMSRQMQEAGLEQGLFVDVFAFAQLDSDPAKAAKQAKSLAFWQRVSYLYYTAHPKIPAGTPLRPLVQAACVVAHGAARLLFPPKLVEARFYEVVAKGDGRGKWIDVFYPAFGEYEGETIFPVKMMPFGDMQVPVPHDVHGYLTTMYGDFMTPPPEEERCAYPPVILDFGDGINVMER